MSAQKRKGSAWESAIVTYLRTQGIDARRVAQTGRYDTGDIHAGQFCIEAKDHAQINLSEFVRQALSEAKNSGLPYGVAVVKKRRSNVKDAYVAMDLETFARLVKAAAA